MSRAPQRAPKAVLGLTALAHDPAASLYIDGELVAAVEEERLSRVKHTEAFPYRAIRFVLGEAGISFRELDCIAYYWDDRGEVLRGTQQTLRQLPTNPGGILRVVGAQVRASRRGPGLLREHLAVLVDGDHEAIPPVAYFNHHETHLVAAWLSAPFEPDAALIVDGRGEYAATSIYQADRGPGRLAKCIESVAFPNSLGVFYGAITQVLGYEAISDEYKVMGLASYGAPDPYWDQRVGEMLHIADDGRYQLNLRLFNVENCSGRELPWLNAAGMELLAGRFQGDDGRFTDAARALAYAAQKRLEEAIIAQAQRIVRRTGARRLVVGGGVAMNGRAIGRLRSEGLFEALHLPLAPYDAGACLGAGLAYLHQCGVGLEQGRALRNPFLGPEYSADSIGEMLRECRWPFSRPADVAADAAAEIAAGRVVGWFDGRMEFGARALGARSILGDPRDPETRERINRSVKRRETFRPFAPSVLEEACGEYFGTSCSRFMGEVVEAKPIAHERVPAVVHIDGSARPQSVPADWPVASYRRLIEAFNELTGVPMVVNTSFNVRGEPIVCSPEDALRCFAASGLERLYLGGFRVDKQERDVSR
ncbi:carbamoyltransferase family protein [Haliangium sp.]|uniref:carbamoyltransferase family protein n=1 Tax=Haliangium sp. TaxID=2663208 RepID=UPI003D09EF60